ncbi:MAG TPA: hypothetical protein VE645_20335 [Pseudonocardiaceae bacterium]|nr:hypothetical protein [Pseudonocardiaceae bacterium]
MRTLPAPWYLRSMADGDTHRGALQRNGYVLARCGTRFAPRLAAYGRLALPGYPLDPAQVCPKCKHAAR